MKNLDSSILVKEESASHLHLGVDEFITKRASARNLVLEFIV